MGTKSMGLGKGLDAIFMDNMFEDAQNSTILNVSEIEPNKNQPRSKFDEKTLIELAESISKHGIIQPLIVRQIVGGKYQIIAGERRWRASKMAGLTEVPVLIRDIDDELVTEIALVENLQREDLSPVEEAKGYKNLSNVYGMSQEEISKAVGKSRPAVANSLRLLKLPEKVLSSLENELISTGHARALLSLKKREEMESLCDLIIKTGMSVRQLENLCKKSIDQGTQKEQTKEKIRFFKHIEEMLNKSLRRSVKITENKNKKGFLTIKFNGEDDLSKLVEILSRADHTKDKEKIS